MVTVPPGKKLCTFDKAIFPGDSAPCFAQDLGPSENASSGTILAQTAFPGANVFPIRHFSRGYVPVDVQPPLYLFIRSPVYAFVKCSSIWNLFSSMFVVTPFAHMNHLLGLKLLSIFYFFAGASLGELISGIVRRKAIDWLAERQGFLAAVLITNVIAVTCAHFLRRRASIEAPIERIARPVKSLIFGIPTNTRIAFLLWGVSWMIGLIVGIAFC